VFVNELITDVWRMMENKLTKDQILDYAFQVIQLSSSCITMLAGNKEKFNYIDVILAQELYNDAVDKMRMLVPYEKEMKEDHYDVHSFVNRAVHQLDDSGPELAKLRPKVIKALKAMQKDKHAQS